MKITIKQLANSISSIITKSSESCTMTIAADVQRIIKEVESTISTLNIKSTSGYGKIINSVFVYFIPFWQGK